MSSILGHRLRDFLGASVLSRMGLAFALVHAGWFFLGVRTMGPPSRKAAAFLDSLQGTDWTLFAGRPFHFAYQSWVLKSLIFADLPAMLVQGIGGLLLWPMLSFVHVGRYEGSYIAAVFLFLIGSLQWLIVGYVIQRRFWPRSF